MAIVCLYIENRRKNVRMLARCGLTGPDGMSNRDSSSWPFSPPAHILIIILRMLFFRADNWPLTNGELSIWQSLGSTPLVEEEVPQPRPRRGRNRNLQRLQSQRGRKAEIQIRTQANPRSESFFFSSPFPPSPHSPPSPPSSSLHLPLLLKARRDSEPAAAEPPKFEKEDKENAQVDKSLQNLGYSLYLLIPSPQNKRRVGHTTVVNVEQGLLTSWIIPNTRRSVFPIQSLKTRIRKRKWMIEISRTTQSSNVQNAVKSVQTWCGIQNTRALVPSSWIQRKMNMHSL